MCEEALKDVFDWLSAGGEVAVFDGTNTTRFEEERKANTIEFIKPFIRQRRELLYSKVVKERGYKLFFVESICEDEAIIEANIRFIFYFVLIEGE